MVEITAEIWDCLSKAGYVRDILKHLIDEFEVEPEECQNDLLVFLEQLEDENLISRQT